MFFHCRLGCFCNTGQTLGPNPPQVSFTRRWRGRGRRWGKGRGRGRGKGRGKGRGRNALGRA